MPIWLILATITTLGLTALLTAALYRVNLAPDRRRTVAADEAVSLTAAGAKKGAADGGAGDEAAGDGD